MTQKHQHTQQLLPQIKKMLEEGMTQKAVSYTHLTLPTNSYV